MSNSIICKTLRIWGFSLRFCDEPCTSDHVSSLCDPVFQSGYSTGCEHIIWWDISALACLWFLCDPRALTQLSSPSLVFQSCLKNSKAKTSVSLMLTSTASREQHYQISSDKTKKDHVGCCPPISSCLFLDILHWKNVCACFERFSAKYLHLNPPPLAITTFTWELAGITVPALSFFH